MRNHTCVFFTGSSDAIELAQAVFQAKTYLFLGVPLDACLKLLKRWGHSRLLFATQGQRWRLN